MGSPKIIAMSDLHFGHHRVQSADTAQCIRDYFFPRLDDSIDILLITGDIYDEMISFDQVDSSIVIELFTDLFVICAQHNIIIRIVRGTYSHDRRQINVIDKLHTKSGINVDYKSYDSISVEYFKQFDINILFIPDNLPFATKFEVYAHIRTLFQVIGIKKVEYIAMHGELSHLVLGHINCNAFEVSELEEFCSRWIFSGHIHKPLVYKVSISVGSFNRLAQNEEEPKGGWILENDKPLFINNEGATVFKTINFVGAKSIEDIIESFDNEVSKVGEKQGFLRVLTSDNHLKQMLAKYNHERNPNIVLTFKNPESKNKGNDFLNNKIRSKQQVLLEIPSDKNVAKIVFDDLQSKGINLDIIIIQQIIEDDILE